MAEFCITEVVEAVAARLPERPAVIHTGGTLTYAEVIDRSRRLGRYLRDRGLGPRTENGAGSSQDLLAQFMFNGPEYLEGMLGGYRARVVPFNVNYRYVAGELRYLLADARPAAVQYHASLAPVLAEVLPDIADVPVLMQVADGSGAPLLPGAVDYEQALASVPPVIDTEPSPDDLYLLYTGGTTGMPKGVMWRQADALVALMAFRNLREKREWRSLAERIAALSPRTHRIMPLAPYMHGASQFSAMQAFCDGNTVVIQNEVRRLDPADAWDSAARHAVTAMLMVGDAFARPLADELEARPRHLPDLRFIYSGGAPLSTIHKRRLTKALERVTVVETMGSSETGVQGRSAIGATHTVARPRFVTGPETVVLSEDLSRVLEPGHEGTGWLASGGRVPLGYLGDPDKSTQVFPTVAGRRFSVPGDRARLLAGDVIELWGRDALTINTGGEKVFAEEVEAVLRAHPLVADAVVCGRPSERWGQEVTALVQLRDGAQPDENALVRSCASQLAGYKLPKAVIFVESVVRSPSGKPDYRWAVTRANCGAPD